MVVCYPPFLFLSIFLVYWRYYQRETPLTTLCLILFEHFFNDVGELYVKIFSRNEKQSNGLQSRICFWRSTIRFTNIVSFADIVSYFLRIYDDNLSFCYLEQNENKKYYQSLSFTLKRERKRLQFTDTKINLNNGNVWSSYLMCQYFFIEHYECYIISEIVITKFVKNQSY